MKRCKSHQVSVFSVTSLTKKRFLIPKKTRPMQSAREEDKNRVCSQESRFSKRSFFTVRRSDGKTRSKLLSVLGDKRNNHSTEQNRIQRIRMKIHHYRTAVEFCSEKLLFVLDAPMTGTLNNQKKRSFAVQSLIMSKNTSLKYCFQGCLWFRSYYFSHCNLWC